LSQRLLFIEDLFVIKGHRHIT